MLDGNELHELQAGPVAIVRLTEKGDTCISEYELQDGLSDIFVTGTGETLSDFFSKFMGLLAQYDIKPPRKLETC